MNYDVFDFDENLWALWNSERGYLSPWLTKRAYQKWWYVHFGVQGKLVPGRYNLYRGEADEREMRRVGN